MFLHWNRIPPRPQHRSLSTTHWNTLWRPVCLPPPLRLTSSGLIFQLGWLIEGRVRGADMTLNGDPLHGKLKIDSRQVNTNIATVLNWNNKGNIAATNIAQGCWMVTECSNTKFQCSPKMTRFILLSCLNPDQVSYLDKIQSELGSFSMNLIFSDLISLMIERTYMWLE